MKAVYIERFGGPEVLQVGELPTPEPGPKEVRIRVQAVALNHLDVWVRRGIGNPRLAFPHVLGADIAGTVDKVGAGVTVAKPGDAVVLNPGVSCGHCEYCLSGQDNLCSEYAILGEHRWGGYAEYVVVPEQNVLPKPSSLNFIEAAAVPLTFLTAWQMVRDKLKVKPGEYLLVMAAGSGVSTAAIQIARLCDVHIIATASSDEKLDRAKELGAHFGVNYSQSDWHREVRKITGGRGVDAVVDHTGAAYWDRVIKATANGGRICLVGASSGYEAVTPLAHIFYRQLTIYGSTMGSKSRMYPILRLVSEGRLRPIISQVLPLEQAAEGHRLLEERAVFGKVVLTVGETSTALA